MAWSTLQHARRTRPLWSWAAFLAAWFTLHGLVALVLWTLSGEAGRVFLWEHFAGPTWAGVNQRTAATWMGVTATTDYTLVSEGTYIATIVVGVASAWWFLAEPLDLTIDRDYILALAPIAAGGALIRSLEDASLFCRPGTLTEAGCQAGPLAFLAVSPMIYILLFLLAVTVTAALARDRTARRDPRAGAGSVDRWLIGQGLVFLAGSLLLDAWLGTTLVWAPLLVALGAPLYRWLRERGVEHVPAGLASILSPWALIPAAYVGAWFLAPWAPAGPTHPVFALWVVGATILTLVATVPLARWLGTRWPTLAPIGGVLGATVVGAHLLDGFGTFFAVCTGASSLCQGAAFTDLGLAAYGQKHPLSLVLLSWWDGWAFPVAKLALPAVFVAGLHWAAEDDQDPVREVGIYLLLVFLAGFVPGVRDVVRTAMGV